MSKMINIKGKEISETTIVEALKKHYNFDDSMPIIEVYNDPHYGKRAVVRLSNCAIKKIKEGNKSIVLDLDNFDCIKSWDEDRFHDYTKNRFGGIYLTNCTHKFGKVK